MKKSVYTSTFLESLEHLLVVSETCKNISQFYQCLAYQILPIFECLSYSEENSLIQYPSVIHINVRILPLTFAVFLKKKT